MFQFQDKVVVVTGGVQGIGKCICEEFAKAGANVMLFDFNYDEVVCKPGIQTMQVYTALCINLCTMCKTLARQGFLPRRKIGFHAV